MGKGIVTAVAAASTRREAEALLKELGSEIIAARHQGRHQIADLLSHIHLEASRAAWSRWAT